jgi:hypothetical protein
MKGKSQPIALIDGIIAGLLFIFGGMSATNLGDQANHTVLALGVWGSLVVTGMKVGLIAYQQSKVTPFEDVVTFRDRDGNIVTGPLASDPARAAQAVQVLTTAPAADSNAPVDAAPGEDQSEVILNP